MKREDVLFETWEWLTAGLVVVLITSIVVVEHYNIVQHLKNKSRIELDFKTCTSNAGIDTTLMLKCVDQRKHKLRVAWETL